MPDVLIVSTCKPGNPVPLFILVEGDDSLLHPGYFLQNGQNWYHESHLN
jgi:hypothetical protein